MPLTLPSPLADVVTILQLHDKTESGQLLLDLLASIVYPDMVCSIFALRALDSAALKSLAVRCIDYSLSTGLTPEESAALYKVIEPRLAARF